MKRRNYVYSTQQHLKTNYTYIKTHKHTQKTRLGPKLLINLKLRFCRFFVLKPNYLFDSNEIS